MGRVLRFVVIDKGVRQAFEKAAPKDLTRMHGVIGRSVLAKIQLGFKFGVSPYGEKWLPLVARSGQPLVDTGGLRRSIYYKADDQGVTIGTKRLATWKGKTSDVAKVHQFGATVVPRPDNKSGLLRFPVGGSAAGAKPSGYAYKAKVVIPARPFFPIRPGANRVELPPVWAKAAVDALKRFLAGNSYGTTKSKGAA